MWGGRASPDMVLPEQPMTKSSICRCLFRILRTTTREQHLHQLAKTLLSTLRTALFTALFSFLVCRSFAFRIPDW